MKLKKRVLALVTTLAVAMTTLLGGTTAVFAADPTGVRRGGTANTWDEEKKAYTGEPNTFFENAPIGTIAIDTSDMTPTNPNIKIVSTNDKIKLNKDKVGEGRTLNNIVWAPNGTDQAGVAAVSIAAGKSADVPGTLTLTWPGIATLQSGGTADVVMVISNIHYERPYKNITDAEGKLIRREATDVHGPISIYQQNGYLGPKMETLGELVGMRASVMITIEKNGKPVEGEVLFTTNDLDVGDPYYGGEYLESLRVDSGAISDAYIPAGNFLAITREAAGSGANGLKFTSTKMDESTYNTGFAALSKPSGISLTWWGQGNGMGTRFFTAYLDYWIKSTTTKGGTIKTTTSGKVPGSTDAGDELGPGTVDVPVGKDVSYLMEPEKGYALGKIVIDDKEIDPDDSSTWPDFIDVTKDSNGNPVVTFKDNAANHQIDVSWDPIVTATTGTGGKISDPGDTTVPSGSDKTYTFTPDPGYTIDKVTVDGKEVTPVDNGDGTWSYPLEKVTDPTKIHVDWKKTYTVTFEDGDHGKSDGKGNETDKPAGSNPKGGNGVTPEDGWEFSGKYTYVITKDDGTTEKGETDDPTKVVVTGNVVFTPVYDPIVTATSGAGGKISDPGDTTVPNGSSKTYTFTPDPGYTIDKVTVDGKEVTPVDNGDGTWSYTIEEISEPTTIDVQWKKSLIPVRFVDPIAGKTIDEQSVAYGDPATEPKAPEHPGYSFKGWDKTFDAITQETTVTAIYEPQKYTVKYDANGGTGTMDPQYFTGTDEKATTRANTFKRAGYQFYGFKAKDKEGNYLKDENGKDLVFKSQTDLMSYLKEMGDGAEITMVAQWAKVSAPAATSTSTKAPKTDDSSQMALWLLMFAASAVAVLLMGVEKRRRR